MSPAEAPTSTRPGRLHPRRPVRHGTSSSTSSPTTSRLRRRPSRPTARASSRAWSPSWHAYGGAPNENRPDRAHQRRHAFLAKIDWQASARTPGASLYNYTRSEQKNGTFDVDSWGRSANALEQDFSHAVNGSLTSHVSSACQRVPLPVREGVPAAAIRRARSSRPSTPLPRHRLRFWHGLHVQGYRFGMPFFIPVDLHDTAPVDRQRLVLAAATTFKAGVEFNRTESNQTFRRLRQRPLHLQLDPGFLNYVANPNATSSAPGRRQHAHAPQTTASAPRAAHHRARSLLYLQQAGVGGLTVEEAGTQSIPQTRAGALRAGQLAATPTSPSNYGLRWEAQIEPDPDHAGRPGLLRAVHRQDRYQRAPSTSRRNGNDPVGLQDVAAPPRHRLGPERRRQAGAPRQRRHLLRPHPRPDPGSSRSTNGSRGQTLFRNSALTAFLGPAAGVRDLLAQSRSASRSSRTSSSSTRTSRTRARSAARVG